MPERDWAYGVPSGQQPSAWRAMLVVVVLVGVIVGTLGLAFYAVIDGASKRNYQDHLRSCLAQNSGRTESNRARRGVKAFMLDASRARAAAAALEHNARLKTIDLRAARQYRSYAQAQVQLPLIDCTRVVKRP